MLLEAENLTVRYGRITALDQLDLAVGEGRIVTVLGANGAGKSSLLKALIGLAPIASGTLRWKGEAINRKPASERVKAGLALVPEGRRILVSMTVEDNLKVGAYHRDDPAEVTREIDAIYQRFPNLAERRHQKAACLSGGEQQMLAVGRALVSGASLMMLDEPSLGLSPIVISRLFELLVELNKGGLALLLVEQNTNMALSVAHEGHVLRLGRKIAQGTPRQLLADARLQEAYLGG
jgi:branched-chain amino acid transport system ATP-binding protein